MSCSRLVCLGMLMLAAAAPRAAGAEPSRVLLIHSYGREFAPFDAFAGNFRADLARQSPQPVDYYEVSLESARFADNPQEGPILNYLQAMFAGRRLDLVVPIGGPAARFAQKYRQQLFPATPMLLAAVDERHLQNAAFTPNDTVVAVRNDAPGSIENILRVLPQTTNIAVVIGTSPLERFWSGELRREFQSFTNRVAFAWLDGLSFEETLKRCAALPPRSAVFYLVLAVDAEGVPHVEERALDRLHAAANAPIFGLQSSQLGRGIVGGPLMSMDDLSRDTAGVAVRILRGEPPGNIRTPPQQPGTPAFDWRELRRWRIGEERLPPGSTVRFHVPTFWEQYRWHIVGVVAFCCLQTALIVGLIVNRARRRQAEAAATLTAELSSKFINLPPGELDREIEGAQRRICECLGLDLSALWQWADETPRYLRLTHLYRPQGGPPTPERFDSRETFPWCVRQMLDGKIVSVTSMESLPPEAARDKETWQHFGIKSNLTFPLSAGGGQIEGALSFNTMREERAWPEQIIRQLQLIAQIFANALARKRADQELRRSEEQLRETAENLPGVVYQFYARDNGQRGLYYMTERVKEVFGVDPEPLDTFFERFTACVAAEDRQKWLESIEEAVRTVRPWEHEAKFIKPGGEEIYIRGISRPQRRDHETVFNGMLRDVSERRLLDLALVESELRYRALFESAPVGILVIGPGGRVLAANPTQARLYGYDSPEQLIGFYAPLFVAEKEREQASQVMRSLLLGEKRSERIYTAVRRDGSEFVVEVTSATLRGSRQEIQGYLCLTRDITALLQAHEVLRQSERKFRELHESMRDAFVSVDSTGRIHDFNSVYQQMLGYSAEELRQVTYSEITPERWHALEAGILRDQVLARGYSDVYEKEYRRKDGTVFPVELRTVLIRNESGRPAAMWAIVRDVTGRKRAEEELQRHRTELAHVSRVSTMGALTASLAHELNQPLSAILSNAQAASRFLNAAVPDVAEVRGALEDIVQDTRRAGEVIRQVRALVRKDEPRLQPLELNHVINGVLRLLHSDMVNRRTQVTLELDPHLRAISGDGVQLQQVLLNIVLNAFDAIRDAPEDRRTVIIRTRRQDLALARVEVSDRGPGLSPERLLRLFEPFRSSKRDGMGLGLSISHSIIEAHKGRLWAENNPEGGATFYFTLPFHEPRVES